MRRLGQSSARRSRVLVSQLHNLSPGGEELRLQRLGIVGSSAVALIDDDWITRCRFMPLQPSP